MSYTPLSPRGTTKNCTDWAQYELPGSSATATLCHGGNYDGEVFNVCPSRDECRLATLRPKPQSTVLASTSGVRGGWARPASSTGTTVHSPTLPARQAPAAARPANLPTPWVPPNMPATRPAGSLAAEYYRRVEAPVVPPTTLPVVMQTPYAQQSHSPAGSMTPTFIPRDDESIPMRLAKNITQGALGSAGWHLYSLANSIDFFPHARST